MSKDESRIQNNVKDFYDRIGWQLESDGFYQNAVYEDLRPVSQNYIHQCHLRVNRHIAAEGKYLLDAGSGPIQWPEYLTYSNSYQYRVCVDLSIEGLREARKRIGNHGLFIVADVVHLPFASDVFDGTVSLHTIHHVPAGEKENAYLELYRTLKPGKTAVAVNGWGETAFMERWMWLVRLSDRIVYFNWKKLWQKLSGTSPKKSLAAVDELPKEVQPQVDPERGTFTTRDNYETFRDKYQNLFRFEVYPWRSVSVRFLRALIHPALFGRLILRRIYSMEERHPEKYGREGQYPMIVISK